MQSNENVEWVSNTTENPECYPKSFDETIKEAKESYWRWRSQLKEGEPKATEDYSVQQLKNMGLIGLYRNI